MNRIHRKLVPANRQAFTLVELLAVVVIIAILGSITLSALYGVIGEAKATRTRTQVAKLHTMIMYKWDSYRVRQVPLPIPGWMKARPEDFDDDNNNCWRDPSERTHDNIYPSTPPEHDYGGAYIRLLALRELMRMELPDRISDLEDGPRAMPIVVPGTNRVITLQLAEPSVWKSYRRKANTLIKSRHGAAGDWTNAAHWSPSHQGAECLYLIVSSIRDGDTSGLDFFKESEIGDTDDDGMPELLDGWGRPIAFLRWAPGFATGEGPDGAWGVAGVDDDMQNGVDDIGEIGWPGSDDASSLQPRDPVNSPDPFDPLKVDPFAASTYALYPLIFSAGEDSVYDISVDLGSGTPVRYAFTCPANYPYVTLTSGSIQMGRPVDAGGDGEIGSFDNITNHLLDSR